MGVFSGNDVDNTGDAEVTLKTPAGVDLLGQQTSAGSLPVVIASNQTAIPVTGTFWQATQPVSGTVTANQGTSPWVISATTLPLPTGAATSALQTTGNASLAAIDAGIPAALGQTTMANSLPVVIASNQTPVPVTFSTAAATNILKTAAITTTSATAGQVILTYTVTAGKTFFLQYIAMGAYLSSQPGNSNPINLGTASMETPSGTIVVQSERFHPKISDFVLTFPQAIPIASGVVIRVTADPSSTSSTVWEANFGGYER